MALIGDIQECCKYIETGKLVERKKYCEKLTNFLENREVIDLINDGNYISWKRIISAIQECLKKDADKITEDVKKKGSCVVKYPSSELLRQVIKLGVRHDVDDVDIPLLVGYIIGCMRDYKMKLCYDSMYVNILLESILSRATCRAKLSHEDWIALFEFIQKYLEEKSEDVLLYKCLMLTIKYGPLSGLPPSLLREQFSYISKLCQKTSLTSPRPQQEHVLEMAIDLCKHTAKDNRVSCCKLGEDIFSNILDLYEQNGREARTKEQLVEFFLLQVTIHQPDGVLENHPCAYARNWNAWNSCLKVLYSVLYKELKFYTQSRHKNSSFFKVKGEKTILCPKFSALFVEVSYQIFSIADIDVSLTFDCTLSTPAPTKRQKVDLTLKSYIGYIQKTKSWIWIHIVCGIMKNYPNIVDIEDYVNLLQILSAIQIESNDYNAISNIYSCLVVMFQIQDKFEGSHLEIEKMWKTIAESTMRAFGLNQHKEETEILLEKLVARRIIEPECILQPYSSGVLNITVQSIRVLETTLQFMNLTKSDKSKKDLISCVLNPQNIKEYRYLLEKRTAVFLVNLTLKQWHMGSSEEPKRKNEIYEYCDIKRIYRQTLFEENVVKQNVIMEDLSEKKCNIDDDMANTLYDNLKNFVKNVPDNIEILLSITVLVTHLIGCLVDYKNLEENDLKNCQLTKLIENIFQLDNMKSFEIYQSKDERKMKKLLENIKIMDCLFSLDVNPMVMRHVKDIVPFHLLRSIVLILNMLQDDEQQQLSLKVELKKAIIKMLSSFCCHTKDRLNQNQTNILEVISVPNYNCQLEDDYSLLLTFLDTLKFAKPGIISDRILENILKSVQDICIARYENSENAVEILNILYDLYPHVALSEDNDNKVTSVALLKPFYDNRLNYGPTVSVAILACISRLCEVDPEITFACWSTVEVINNVPEFLCSDYQEVRFKAIDTLVTFYKINAQSKQLQSFHRQERVFIKICDMSHDVFAVAGEISEERKIDEVISRTASVLHTFADIIINCNAWIEECLFALLKLSSKKKIDSVDKILSIINEHLMDQSEKNILEKYLENLLEKWLTEGLSIENFVFKLFNCQSKAEFYLKYFENCVPFLMVSDRKDLIAAAKQLGYTEKDIVQRSCAKIFGQLLCKHCDTLHKNVITTNNILAYYTHIVGLEELIGILISNVDEILLVVLENMTDEKYILEMLGANVIFLSKNLSAARVQKCIDFMQGYLFKGVDFIQNLAEMHLGKLQNILLSLKVNIYTAVTVDDRIKALHRYIYFLNTVIDSLSSTSIWQDFFIRDTTYSIINLLANNINSSELSSAVCKFFKSFCQKILPKFSIAFEKFINFTVNSLKNFAVSNTSIRNACLEILHLLIVDNCSNFVNGIEKLDNFPQDLDFDKIRTVHNNIKYGKRGATLEQEVNFFLEHDDLTTRIDSLVHLKEVLSNKKQQLKEMYEKLQDVRGFSEDCEKSAIHRLIRTLARLSWSTDEKVSFAASRCLGELGPANLMTLVLEPEQMVSILKYVPFELLTGQVISLLSDYIVDADIKVVEAASKSFYEILDCKEGRNIGVSKKDFGHGCIEKKYILPYFSSDKVSLSNVALDMETFIMKVDNEELWCPTGQITHRFWITCLVTNLLETFTDKSYLQKLVPICKVKPKFSEKLLPLLINLLFFLNYEEITEALSSNIDRFFSLHWRFTVPKHAETNSVTVNKKSVRCMLKVVRLVRLQKDFNKSKARSVGELNVNYLKVAKAAEFCAAHFTALLYSDLWCQMKIEEIQNRDKSYAEQRSTMLDIIYENEGEEVGEALQNILRTAYKAVGDLDALPGCGISFLLKPQFRVEHYKELGKWDQVMHFYAMQASHGKPASFGNLMESFKKCSLYQMPLLCSEQCGGPPYECLWRLGQWDTCEKRKLSIDNSLKVEDFEKYRFHALKSLHDHNQYYFEDYKKLETKCVIEDLRHTSLESSQNLYPILTRLQSIVEMEDFAQNLSSQNILNILDKWKQQTELISNNDFCYLEPIVAQRITMINDYLKTTEDSNLKNYLIDMTLDLARLAKDEGFFKEGLTFLEDLKFMTGLSEDTLVRIQLMDAQLSWLVNNTLVARHILNKLCKSENITPKLKAAALKLSGQYMSETRSENSFTIIHNYFIESLSLMKNVDKNDEDCVNILDTYDKLAQYADRQYQQIMTYMKSDLFQRKIVNMEKAKQAASSIQKQRKRTHDESKAAAIQDRQSSIDETEINATKKDYNQLLVIALKFYLLNLQHSDHNNLRIFRIMSLFLENRSNQEISPTIEQYLAKIPSYKYIVMLPQLVPHIADNNTDLFAQKVNEIVEKCALEHPHHTLPLLLSLANANKDREFSDQKTKTCSNDARIATANKLLAKLKKYEGLKTHVNKLQLLSLALIDLAYYQDTDRKKEYAIPKTQKISKIVNFDDILLPTFDLKVRADKKYENIIGIASFDKVFHPVGGINAPKRIKCRGTDGIARSQLVKGCDDLRQDAVMQQVFTIMNSLLSKNKQTRNLLIRTYKIVPLSMRSGILQWVDNSMPIGMYLVGEDGKSGAHALYRPSDKSPTNCKDLFKRCAGKSTEEKQKVFRAICQSFKPVLHKFFENSFPQPTIWYERRRAYIYSVATTSMCGYILGIGDRHVSNILIDKTTAEVIHIDFGIAFEQGKVLPTPETVPFRLTRDIVDGMGVSGVEGLFRRSCEKTMEVLRLNAQTIITIVEVLLYDPLYAWTVTAAEANKRQTEEDITSSLSSENSDEERTVNITAERALLRLREKLQGTELGHPVSIEHQVGTLIQQAIDPANLSKLYFGWQPYL